MRKLKAGAPPSPPPALSECLFFFDVCHCHACPALWAMNMSRTEDTPEVAPRAYSPLAWETKQRQAEIEAELGRAQASPYTTPPQSPDAPSEGTIPADFSPSTPKTISTVESPTWSPRQKRRRVNLSTSRFATLITHADSPSSSTIPTSSLSAAWDHWEPVFLIIELLGRERSYPTTDYLD